MKVIHNKKFTVIEVCSTLGELYNTKREVVTLKKEDLVFIKTSLNEAKQMKLIEEELNIEEYIDAICEKVFSLKNKEDINKIRYIL